MTILIEQPDLNGMHVSIITPLFSFLVLVHCDLSICDHISYSSATIGGQEGF